MKCITGARTPLFYNNQRQQHYHQYHLHISKTRSLPQPQRYFYASNTRTTKALRLSDLVLVLAADINIIPQPKGDIKVFFQTGGLMLLAYLLANFVIPNIVLKQLNEPESVKSNDEAETSNEQQQITPKKTKKKEMNGG